MHKTLRDFEIQTDHLITARRPDQEIVNQKKKKKKKDNQQNSGLCSSGRQHGKTERKQKEK